MKQRLLNFNFVFLGLTALFFLASCAGSKKVSENTSENVQDAVATVKGQKVLNTATKKTKVDKIMVYLGDESVVKWKLISINNQNASELYANLPMMRFDEPWKQIYGTTGCNKFTAYYLRDNNVIGVSRVSATQLQCDNGNEPLFLDTLASVNEVQEDGSTLSLLVNGQTVLVFERF